MHSTTECVSLCTALLRLIIKRTCTDDTASSCAVHAKNLYSYGCTVTATCGGGFAQKGKPAGSFSSESTIDGIFSHYGEGATGKGCHPHSGVKWTFDLPSCQACSLGGFDEGRKWNVTITNVQTFGYPAPSDRTICKSTASEDKSKCLCAYTGPRTPPDE